MEGFVYLSRYAGMREDFVQAGGGNSSVKLSSSEMLIKASGSHLADLSESKGWCRVNPAGIVEFFSQGNPEITEEAEKKLLSGCRGKVRSNPSEPHPLSVRPSIEVFLHSVTRKYTLHTHPTVVNILASTDEGWKDLQGLFPEALFVGYATPGIKLAAEYFRAYRAFGKMPDIIFLKNHGLVVSSDSAEAVKEKTEQVLHIIEEKLGLDMEGFHAATRIYDVARAVPELKDKIVWKASRFDIQKSIAEFGSSLWDWQFCPDCIVYCGTKPLVLDAAFSESDFAHYIGQNGVPVVVSYMQHVYIIADSVKKAKDTESVLAFSAAVASANKGKKMNLLSDSEQGFLLNWDAEKYRQRMK